MWYGADALRESRPLLETVPPSYREFLRSKSEVAVYVRIKFADGREVSCTGLIDTANSATIPLDADLLINRPFIFIDGHVLRSYEDTNSVRLPTTVQPYDKMYPQVLHRPGTAQFVWCGHVFDNDGTQSLLTTYGAEVREALEFVIQRRTTVGTES